MTLPTPADMSDRLCSGMNQLNPRRRILALKFQLEATDGKILELIAWLEPDGNGKHLYPAHPDRTLMDVKAGDMLIFKRKDQLTIKRLKPWRTRECKDDTQYEEIVCGRDWEAG